MKQVILKWVVGLIVLGILSIFVYPDPSKEYSGFFYGFFTGSYHGATIVPNYLISFFDKTRLLKAVNYSGWYNFNWWFWAIANIFTLFVKPVLGMFAAKKIQ